MCKNSVGRRISAAGLFTVLLAFSAVALARAADLETRHRFNIPAQALDTALLAFSDQAKVQILMWAGTRSELQSPGARGDFKAADALSAILSNTGLAFREIDTETVAIVQSGGQRTGEETSQSQTVDSKPWRAVLAQVQPSAQAPAASADASESRSSPKSAGDSSESAKLEEIVVTGTRIVRDGYSAPTPLTVVGSEEIAATAPQNVADYVNTIPSVFASSTPRNQVTAVAGSTFGMNGINLRGLGLPRTLILLDGRRSVPTTVNGIVNVNEFPQQLISRVEIVTGGASSAYGSDAVAGVVNFILDKDFTGVKADVESGQTTYGDGKHWKLQVSSGMEFAGGRGHLLLSGEINKKDAILGIPRDWANRGVLMVNNPAFAVGNGQPQYIVTPNAAANLFTYGGIIINTALRGTAFGPGGTPYQFNYGALGGPWMVGGQWQANQFFGSTSLDSEEERYNLFSRLGFEITDNIELFAQVSRGNTRSIGYVVANYNFGDIVVRQGNPFIPAPVAAQMTALGIAQFNIGSMNGDLSPVPDDVERTVDRYMVGANGKFSLFGNDWGWDAFYERGIAKEHDAAFTKNVAKFAQALDAVRNPITGAIVCASTLIDPNNGCSPYDPMGTGVNTQAALDYVLGYSILDQRLTQDTAAVNAHGEAFATWAGPISFATGLEYRNQKVTGSSDPISQARGWLGGNFLATVGKYHVAEGYMEAVAPLLKDVVAAKALELNTAVRYTDYSTSGSVTTWKIGATYQPVEDLRFRATRSRDIRAPNLGELYLARIAGRGSINNRFANNPSATVISVTTGNPNLVPEEADTFGVGLVYQPSWASGLQASVDYYSIKIKDGIGTVSAQTIVDRCFQGESEFCSALTFNGTEITQVDVKPLNFARQGARGLDVELTYTLDLNKVMSSMNGTLAIRGLFTRFLENLPDGVIDTAGTNGASGNGSSGPPDWVYRLTMAYKLEPVTVTLTGRGVSSGVNNALYIECTSNCPAPTTQNPTVNDNHAPGAFYLDAGLAYGFEARNGTEGEVFFAVQNLLDRDPPLFGASGPGIISALVFPANPSVYDVLGRMYRAGLRVKF